VDGDEELGVGRLATFGARGERGPRVARGDDVPEVFFDAGGLVVEQARGPRGGGVEGEGVLEQAQERVAGPGGREGAVGVRPRRLGAERVVAGPITNAKQRAPIAAGEEGSSRARGADARRSSCCSSARRSSAMAGGIIDGAGGRTLNL
jgi:hypothetical protein